MAALRQLKSARGEWDFSTYSEDYNLLTIVIEGCVEYSLTTVNASRAGKKDFNSFQFISCRV